MELKDIKECTYNQVILSVSDKHHEYEKSSTQLEWEKVVSSAGPFPYFFTLSFVRKYSDTLAVQAAKAWCTLVNNKISGPYWRENGTGLGGVIAAERHKRSLTKSAGLHFHFLIRETHVPGDRLRFQAESNALRLTDSNGEQMTSPDCIKFIETYSQEGPVTYLTKEVDSFSFNGGDNIAFLNSETGMEDFCFVKSGYRW